MVNETVLPFLRRRRDTLFFSLFNPVYPLRPEFQLPDFYPSISFFRSFHFLDRRFLYCQSLRTELYQKFCRILLFSIHFNRHIGNHFGYFFLPHSGYPNRAAKKSFDLYRRLHRTNLIMALALQQSFRQNLQK